MEPEDAPPADTDGPADSTGPTDGPTDKKVL
jgi:hypothetical protein